MNYRQARIFMIAAVIIVALVVCGLLLRKVFASSEEEPLPQTSATEQVQSAGNNSSDEIRNLHIDRRVSNLAKQFADLNDDHLVYAKKIGIRPIEKTSDILKIRRPIQHLESNDNYYIDNLSHSYAYLVPEAAALLDTIGARFNRKLHERGGGRYTIKVTSLLRTRESINRLQHGNVNSTSNSAHLYATTFDISYVDFKEHMFNTRKFNDGQLKNLLAEVLLELKDEGKCLVKFERKQGCFHITATGK